MLRTLLGSEATGPWVTRLLAHDSLLEHDAAGELTEEERAEATASFDAEEKAKQAAIEEQRRRQVAMAEELQRRQAAAVAQQQQQQQRQQLTAEVMALLLPYRGHSGERLLAHQQRVVTREGCRI